MSTGLIISGIILLTISGIITTVVDNTDSGTHSQGHIISAIMLAVLLGTIGVLILGAGIIGKIIPFIIGG